MSSFSKNRSLTTPLTIFILLLIIKNNNINAWKPITGSPVAFSVQQSHPAMGSSSNADASSQETHHHQTITTYHGNAFDNNIPSPSFGPAIGSERVINNHPSTTFNGAASNYLLGNYYSNNDNLCSVDKFAFENEGTVKYAQTLPKLEQITLCSWMRFTNHSGDHTIFTYSVEDQPREIQLWVANSKGSSFISMAIHGQSLFRLNYPLKMRVWHHACGSWNGKTGEWQLWVKAERVGRGFHNRLVGHVIKPNGIAYSGGPSITGPVGEGLHQEVTMIQIYKVALSAGKAHRDHKHHHVHHFDHNGPITSTPQPVTQQPMPVQQTNPLLANGQFPSRVRINFAGANPTPALPVKGLPSQIVGGHIGQLPTATINTQFTNGQFHAGGRLLSEQLVSGNILQGAQRQPLSTVPSSLNTGFKFSSIADAPTSFAEIGNPANIQYIDDIGGNKQHLLYKRDSKKTKKIDQDTSSNDKKLNKRGIIMLNDGTLIDDSLLVAFDGLAQFGAPAFKKELSKLMGSGNSNDEVDEDEIREHDREPAEGEVEAVLSLCGSCDSEPFQGAIVMAWKEISVEIHNALQAKTVGSCGKF